MNDRDTVRRATGIITVAYVSALTLLGGLTIGIHVLLDQTVAELSQAGRVVNEAGRQRMLSQRIYWLATEMQASQPVQAALEQATDTFAASHRHLSTGNIAEGLSETFVTALRPYYFEAPHNVDAAVRRYLSLSRAILSGESTAATLPHMRRMASDDLLSALDAVVMAYEQQVNGRVASLQRIQTLSIVAVIIVLLLEAIFIFRPLVWRIRQYAARLYEFATLDALTGLPNRRHFIDLASRTVHEKARYRIPASVLMLDIDRFKAINDTLGHATGDKVIARTGALLSASCREQDVPGRVGGEEFAILVKHADLAGARIIAERIRRAIEAELVAGPSGQGDVRWTVSIGAVEIAEDETLEAAIARADELLYRAKRSGRNRVESAPDTLPAAA